MMNVRLYFVDDKYIITFQLGIKYCKYCNMAERYCDELWNSNPDHHTHELYLGKLLQWENILVYLIRNSRILEPLPRNSCIEMKSAFVDTCTVVHHSYTYSSRFTHPTTDAMISNLLYSGCIYSVYLKVFYFESACFQVFYLESACYM